MSRCNALVRLLVGVSFLGCAAAAPSTSGTGGSTATGATTGSGGSSPGTGGSGVMTNPPSSYAQNAGSPTAAFPYPQGHALPNCSFPTYSTDIVETAYQNWKAAFFDGTKVTRPENGNDTVSEGIGYGMLIGVFMNDEPMFDALWSYAKSHFDGNGLMTWCQGTGQTGSCNSSGSATDGDEDMAYALLMASKQWSGGTYASDAATLIGNIYTHEVSGNILLPGDSFGSSGLNELDPSYFAPSYYRAFAGVDSGHDWMDVLNECYTILANAQGGDGLVPNWVNQSGTGVTVGGAVVDPYFGYDACRIPFRIAMDWCINGQPMEAQTYAGLITTFYSSKSTATSLAGIVDGYTTTGGAPPSSTGLGVNSAGMAFTGPAGVAAMAAGDDTLRNISYLTARADTTGTAMKINGTFTYFHASWGVLSLMAMSGNFWDMTQ
jgi:endo-1,4-beta-D-glucanase Y